MTPRRIREIRKSTVVLSSDEWLTVEALQDIGDMARRAFPGRRHLILTGGWTVSGV